MSLSGGRRAAESARRAQARRARKKPSYARHAKAGARPVPSRCGPTQLVFQPKWPGRAERQAVEKAFWPSLRPPRKRATPTERRRFLCAFPSQATLLEIERLGRLSLAFIRRRSWRRPWKLAQEGGARFRAWGGLAWRDASARAGVNLRAGLGFKAWPWSYYKKLLRAAAERLSQAGA